MIMAIHGQVHFLLYVISMALFIVFFLINTELSYKIFEAVFGNKKTGNAAHAIICGLLVLMILTVMHVYYNYSYQ